MMPIVLLGVLAGAVLGLRLRVLALVPAVAVSWILIAVGGILSQTNFAALAFAMFGNAVALQMGYAVGATFRYALAATRMRRAWRAPRPKAQLATDA